MLSEFGCDIAQGYLISKPAPADRLEISSLTATWRGRPLGTGALTAVGAGQSETNGGSPA